jgi:Ca2+-binding EF-hand superfamily protein
MATSYRNQLQQQQQEKLLNKKAFEGRRKEYVDYHHLTEIPASYRNWTNRSNTTEKIEELLHMKLSEKCVMDRQLYKLIHGLFKDQYRRAGRDAEVTGINKDDFFEMLTIMGLFPNREQSDELFDKYDTNGSNNLSIHEFWVQARPRDYKSLPAFENKQKTDEVHMNRAKKRVFIKESLLNIPVTVGPVHRNVYSLPTERMYATIKDKIWQRSNVDKTLSNFRTRKFLESKFLNRDEERRGYVRTYDLERVLNGINFPHSPENLMAIAAEFPGPEEGTVDYRALCMKIYPDERDVATSGYVGTNMVRRHRPVPFQNRSMYSSGSMTARAPSRTRSRSLSRHSVHSNRPLSQGQNAPARLPNSRAPTPPPQPQTSRVASRVAGATPPAGPRQTPPPIAGRRATPVRVLSRPGSRAAS